MTTPRRSHLMHGALELLRDGVAPRDAALASGVTLQALYRAMRQEGIGTRCPTCGKLATRSDSKSNRETLDAGYSAPVEPGLDPISSPVRSTD